MARSRTGWEVKLRPELQPRVVRDPRQGDQLLIPTPLLVAEEVGRVARGKVLTLSELRTSLAKRFKADRTCPMTTGIFAAIVAGAVREDIARRRKPRWPIWRLVRDDGSLNPNWPLSGRYRAALLRDEGMTVTRAGTTWRALVVVADETRKNSRVATRHM
jgi:hypothetical protein